MQIQDESKTLEIDSDTALLDEDKQREMSKKGSFLTRSFSKMQTGSLRGSVFTLCLTAIGPEYLFSCAILKFNGLIIGLALVMLLAFVSRYSLNILVRASDEHKIYNYPHLVEHLLGSRHSNFLECAIILYEVGMLIGLQVMLGDIMPLVIESFGANIDRHFSGAMSMIFFNLAVMTPLGMFRDLTSLQYVSFSGIIGISYITLVTFAEFPFFVHDHGLTGIHFARLSGEFLVSVPLCLLLYFGHTNVCTVAGELAETSQKRMYKVTLRTMLTLQTINFFISLFGYMSALEDTPDVWVIRDSVPILGSDWPMILGRMFICITLITAIPINLNPIRSTLTNLFFNNTTSLQVHLGLSFSLLWSTLIIALLIPNVLTFFGFVAGLCATTISCLYPALVAVKISGEPWNSPSNLFTLSVLLFAYLVSISSAIYSIINIASS
mmetsp:Transcript_34317/g.60078  ORF Transcript_34317/g.60078 Transcript_34317/m.60078 type:complete len:438 (-) Transcript_34317:712-2025(-)